MINEIRTILGPHGPFAAVCEDYEYRDEQIEMACAVGDAVSHSEHLLVEAGTGVGKTVAYLVPAVLRSSAGTPVIVSTHTKNLQAQLIQKDIPLMQDVMSDYPFAAVLMKGRSNYLCLQELDNAEQSVIFHGDKSFDKLKKWAQKTETGDVSELDFAFDEWYEVCANGDTCRHHECKYYEDKCLYYKMRRRAQSADIIVVNHALFLADLALKRYDERNSLLPRYETVIIDEAHHLESVATDSFGIEISNHRIPFILSRLRKRKEIPVTRGEYQMIEEANKSLFERFQTMRKQEFFLDEYYENGDRESMEDNVRELVDMLGSLSEQITSEDLGDDKELKERLEGYKKMVDRLSGEMKDAFFSTDENYFRWVERSQTSRFANMRLNYSPVNVSELLGPLLWDTVDTVVCTSATLSTSGSFSYMKERLGISEANELILGSPFDYMEQVLLYVPEDMDFPSEKEEYADQVAERIAGLLDASGGRAFLLFTSYRMLNSVFERLSDEVPYRLLRQGEMSNERLVAEFRKDEDTCLMGVHSFWEGVDIKGERLSLVVIDKLPFAVPDSPVNQARCQAIEDAGGNWFTQYSIPQAQIRLKQGFGRLVRTKSDRGVVAILDSRIHKKYYGKEFLKYLPRCKGTKTVDKVVLFLQQDENVGATGPV